MPPAIRPAARCATARASVGSSEYSSKVAAGPSGSTAVNFSRSRAALPWAPAMIRLASVTTCGVDR